MSNRKAARPDHVQGFWFTKMTKLNPRLQESVQEGVQSGNVPEWMTKCMAVLIQKDPTKGTKVSKYHPIACLPIIWKFLKGIMGEKLYIHLERNGLLADQQKRCRKRSRGQKNNYF